MPVEFLPVRPSTDSTVPGRADVARNELGKQDFLRLLITQLQNQDPLSPMNDREFLAQMSQFSSLEATQAMGKQLNDVLVAQQQAQALAMVGREVDFADEAGATRTGKVAAALLHEATPILLIEGTQVALSAIKMVR